MSTTTHVATRETYTAVFIDMVSPYHDYKATITLERGEGMAFVRREVTFVVWFSGISLTQPIHMPTDYHLTTHNEGGMEVKVDGVIHARGLIAAECTCRDIQPDDRVDKQAFLSFLSQAALAVDSVLRRHGLEGLRPNPDNYLVCDLYHEGVPIMED